MTDLPENPEWDDRDGERELSLPFVCTKTEGGQYEDLSFVAGYQVGEISGQLFHRAIVVGTYLVYSDLCKQLDLVAMKHGYVFDVLNDDGVWAQVGFTRIEV